MAPPFCIDLGDLRPRLPLCRPVKGTLEVEMPRRSQLFVMLCVLCLAVTALVGAAPGTDKPPSIQAIAGHLEQSRLHVDRMRTLVVDTMGALEAARSGQNLAAINCLNSALGPMKGLLRLAEQTYLALAEAASRKDAGQVEHEYVKVAIAYNKVEELHGQAQGCGGPELGIVGDGIVDRQKFIDDDVPDVDSATMPYVPINDHPPPSASPFYATD